jgi:hypothetical protein
VSWLRTFLRLTPVVAAACAVSVVGLVVFRHLAPWDDLGPSSNDVGNYLQTLGGIYAVLLAFAVFVVWGQFNEGRGFVEREATALVDLHRTASGLPNPTRLAIQTGLAKYIDIVISEEWHAMARRDEATIERVGHHLDEVWLAIHRCRPATECQHVVYGEVLRQFNELTDLRTSRLTSSRMRLPQSMKILMFVGAILTVGSMWFMLLPPLWLHAIATAALAGAVSHIIYIILDLDAAFDGKGNMVPTTAFERARRQFEREAHLVDIDACA